MFKLQEGLSCLRYVCMYGQSDESSNVNIWVAQLVSVSMTELDVTWWRSTWIQSTPVQVFWHGKDGHIWARYCRTMAEEVATGLQLCLSPVGGVVLMLELGTFLTSRASRASAAARCWSRARRAAAAACGTRSTRAPAARAARPARTATRTTRRRCARSGGSGPASLTFQF